MGSLEADLFIVEELEADEDKVEEVDVGRSVESVSNVLQFLDWSREMFRSGFGINFWVWVMDIDSRVLLIFVRKRFIDSVSFLRFSGGKAWALKVAAWSSKRCLLFGFTASLMILARFGALFFATSLSTLSRARAMANLSLLLAGLKLEKT